MDIPKPNLIPEGRKIDKTRLIIVFSAVLALIVVVAFVSKIGFTSFTVREEQQPTCADECSFEGKICEESKIFECVTGENGCKQKNLVESCPEKSVCSTLKEGTCYTPQACDFSFHTCVTKTSYQLCNDGKTIEGSETRKCPGKLVCNKKSNNFAVCVEEK